MKKEKNEINKSDNLEIKKDKTKKVINKKLVLAGIILIIFIIYTILVKLNVLNKLDTMVESFIIGIRNDTLTNFMSTITNLGGAYFLISTTIIIGLIAIIKNKALPINTMINLTCIFLLNELAKQIVRRPRPTGLFLTEATGFSYPSGHTIVSYVFYTFIGISLCEKIKSKPLKIFIRIITLVIPITIAFSRIYLGVHYITDVIGGYLLGSAYLIIFLYLRDKHIKKIRGNK